MPPKTNFIHSSFTNLPPGVTASDKHTLTHNVASQPRKTTANESIPTNVDGVHVCAFQLTRASAAASNEMFGITTAQSTSSWLVDGIALYVVNGSQYPSGGNIIGANISTVAKEIVVVFTVSNNGAKKEIKFIVDGNSSTTQDVTANFNNAAQVFSAVVTYEINNKITSISFSQLVTRTGEIATLMKEYEESLKAPAGPPPTPTLIPEALAGNFREHLAAKLDGDTVHVVLFGLPQAGKSTIYKSILYLLKGAKFVGGPKTGEAAGGAEGGQLSTTCIREEMSFYLGKKDWDVKKNGDLLLTDTVGSIGDGAELAAIAYGKLKEIDAFPRDSSVESTHKRAEILNRKPQTVRATTFVLFISVDQLENKNDAANDKIIKSILNDAQKNFKAGEFQVEIPVMIVLTKADKLSSSPEPKDLLFQNTSPKLAHAFKKCQERFGVPQDDIFAIGFNHETSITDFSAGTKDPRVLALRHLVLRMTEGAQIALTRFNNFEEKEAIRRKEEKQQQELAEVAKTYGMNLAGPSPYELKTLDGNDDEAHVPDLNASEFRNHKSVSESGSPAKSSVVDNVKERLQQVKEIEAEMKKVGAKKYLANLTCDELRIVLAAKNVAPNIVKAISEEGYTGAEFVEPTFLEDGLGEEIQKKYDIKKLQMTTFGRIRDALLV
jgi:hypothetical protein